MIPIIYVIIALAWTLVILGFKIKDYWILAFTSFLLMALGLYIAMYGLADVDNFATQTFAIIHIGMGAYVIIRGAYEVYKNGL